MKKIAKLFPVTACDSTNNPSSELLDFGFTRGSISHHAQPSLYFLHQTLLDDLVRFVDIQDDNRDHVKIQFIAPNILKCCQRGLIDINVISRAKDCLRMHDSVAYLEVSVLSTEIILLKRAIISK